MRNNKTTNYSVGDFFIRVKNAAIAKNKEVSISKNKEIAEIAKCLKKMGYLDEVESKDDVLKVMLTFKAKRPMVSDIKLISKPGRRVYIKVAELTSRRGPSSYVISTPKGIVSSKEAIKLGVGGEVLAEIW